MKRIKYILSGVGIKGRIKMGLVLIVIRSVLDIAYNDGVMKFSSGVD
jgi:hypothetical protein